MGSAVVGADEPPEGGPQVASSAALTSIRILSDDRALVRHLQSAFGPLIDVLPESMKGLVGAEHVLSSRGRELVRQARLDGVLLVEWRLNDAPVINTLGYHLRLEPVAPLIALCANPAEEVAALAAGCDAAVGRAVQAPMIRGVTLAYIRLVTAARASIVHAGATTKDAQAGTETVGALRIDRVAGRIYANDVEVDLTPREYGLLDFMIARAGRLCSREEILMGVWGIDFDTGTNMVDVYMHFVRKKLETHDAAHMIRTVRGRGYRLEVA